MSHTNRSRAASKIPIKKQPISCKEAPSCVENNFQKESSRKDSVQFKLNSACSQSILQSSNGKIRTGNNSTNVLSAYTQKRDPPQSVKNDFIKSNISVQVVNKCVFKKPISNARQGNKMFSARPKTNYTAKNVRKPVHAENARSIGTLNEVQKKTFSNISGKTMNNSLDLVSGKTDYRQNLPSSRWESSLKQSTLNKSKAGNLPLNLSKDKPKTHASARSIPVQKQDNQKHVSQPDIEFEANEMFRDMILNERQLTPQTVNHFSGVTMMNPDRPSLYQKYLKETNDHHQAAIKACEDPEFIQRNRRISEMKMKGILSATTPNDRNSLYGRASLYRQKQNFDPHERAMKRIEELRSEQKLKSEKKVGFHPDRRISEMKMKSILLAVTPNDRDSLYGRASHYAQKQNFDPHERAIKRIEELRSNQKLKSGKKVRFCPDIEQFPNEKENYPPLLIDKLYRLTVVSEKEEDSRQSGTPDLDKMLATIPRSVASANFASPILSDEHKKGIYDIEQHKDKPSIENSWCKPLSISENICEDSRTPTPVLFDKDFTEILETSPATRTPLVLQQMYEGHGLELGQVRLKLDFSEESSAKLCSNDQLKQEQKNNKSSDELADNECSFILSTKPVFPHSPRGSRNPLALTLVNGDHRHFVPVKEDLNMSS